MKYIAKEESSQDAHTDPFDALNNESAEGTLEERQRWAWLDTEAGENQGPAMRNSAERKPRSLSLGVML